MREFARTVPARSKVLEIGSGPVDGSYSAERYLSHCDVTTSDINPAHGRRVIDVTAIPYPDEAFDVVIATNVLEHVWDYATAVSELRRVVRRGGTIFVMVPFLFPLHDEPHDYWRFTSHTLSRLFDGMDTTISYAGTRRLPLSYRVRATKPLV